MRNVLISAAVAAATFAMPASAATIVSTSGSFAAPTGAYTIDFNSAVAAPFTVTAVNATTTAQGNVGGLYAEPAGSDGSQYAAVYGQGSLTLASQLAFTGVSFFVGSIDAGNKIELLSSAGTVVASFSGPDFSSNTSGDTGSALTNRRVTISDVIFSSVRFTSQQNSFELDNVVFAVPEASTWALMLVGFGMVGAATRYRRRKSVVAFS